MGTVGLDGWFEELAALEFLGLGKEEKTEIAGRPITRYKSGRSLVFPKTVFQFPDVVLYRNNKGSPKNIWSVLTREAEIDNEGNQLYELVGKEWNSITPFKFKGTLDEIAENFVVLRESESMIKAMVKARTARVKAGII